MVMKAFGTCEWWFPCLPYIPSAGWVGTIMHGQIDGMGEQRQNSGTLQVTGVEGTQWTCYLKVKKLARRKKKQNMVHTTKQHLYILAEEGGFKRTPKKKMS
jgi:hypothetical protein